ncbi:MAG: ribonuclease [Naasia sp.]|nr:ribonuclease [Naasia sp.]
MAERVAAKPRRKPPGGVAPNLKRERELAESGARLVIGCDEVGRGAIAGPVAIGMCVVDLDSRPPRGLRDSKLLPQARREQLAPLVDRWAMHSAVGMASNEEIDEFGLTAALGLAGARALLGLLDRGFAEADAAEAVVLLDGNSDYLTRALAPAGVPCLPRVTTRIKADLTCASVSGASVLAKVARDGLMINHHDTRPHYGWVSNKGYGSATHWAAIDEHGPSPLHRHTWLRTPSLFELDADSVAAEPDDDDGDGDPAELAASESPVEARADA